MQAQQPQPQAQKPNKTAFYISAGFTTFLSIVFLSHLSIAYKFIAAQSGSVLLVMLIVVILAAYGWSILAMYAGRRQYFRRLDLWAALILPTVFTVILLSAVFIAFVVGG